MFGLEHMLIILRLSENGMAKVVVLGWHEDGKRYWFLLVFFLNKFTSILPFSMLREVSRKGIELVNGQSHLSSIGSSLSDVCVIVNFSVGCIWFMSWSKLWSCFVLP